MTRRKLIWFCRSEFALAVSMKSPHLQSIIVKSIHASKSGKILTFVDERYSRKQVQHSQNAKKTSFGTLRTWN